MPTLPDGYALAHFQEIDSTNLEACRLAEAGEHGPIWLWADLQLAGRGRLGRNWFSERGNLYASLLLPLKPGERPYELSFVAALAVFSAAYVCLPQAARKELALKWPNDLLLDEEKTAGILLEQAGSISVAIGCGVNLGNVPQEDLRRPATGLAVHGSTADASAALEHLAETMDHWIKVWRNQGFHAIRVAWLERAMGHGEIINVSQSDGVLTGRFTALDENGALLLELPSGEITRILAADIELAA